MYRIAHIAAESNVGLDDMLRKIVEILPVALQYPQLAKARILLGGRSFCSDDFTAGPYRLSADLVVRGEPEGTVEVFYTQPAAHAPDELLVPMEEPFLAEEQHLIVGVARELNSIIERKYAEEEKLQLREQVRHANRMVTIGQLAAGVAHELNEPLGNILGFAQLAISSPNLNDQTRRDIEKIEKASLYAREIIRKLMFFSRQTPSRKIDVSLQAVVEDALSLLESRCDTAGIELVRNLAPELPLIHGDPAQLQQVLVNLAVNAIQSMPNGGTLTITTRQEQDTQCLVVEDSGSGIAPDDIKNLFLPFFTTKEVGEGTGLGLSVVHGIVSSHGGSVHVESQLGSGTRFEVRLPANVPDPGNGDGDGK
jgi:signal transduction histidine kinase